MERLLRDAGPNFWGHEGTGELHVSKGLINMCLISCFLEKRSALPDNGRGYRGHTVLGLAFNRI